MARECGTCSACCRWPSVPEIGKPARTPCQYLAKRGHGCVAYEHRPEACASYRCSWLRGTGAEEDQPVRCHVLIDRRLTQFGHVLVAKPLRPEAAMTEKGRAAIQRATRDGVIRVGKMETDHTVIVDRILSQMGLVDGR